MGTFHILSFGVIVHIVFLLSVFDMYFKSTVIVGISPINNTIPSIGKRVVMISVDGLRVDSLFDPDSHVLANNMMFMKSVMEERGVWGVSESHVPTESRPGHVAMLAGFYEDPSAVTRGWKENPVTFDSVFNQSVCSFAWGSPDILNIFFNGLNRSCAYHFSYENEQNFAGDTMEYDNWVYREFKSFLYSSKNNKELFDKGVLIFLHLLGQDTSGHTHKPHTQKYLENTKNVDRLIREFELLVNEFYRDNLTTFVFTSDHGMTDWGSHGAGDPNETNTPFVAWGAGITYFPAQKNPLFISQADVTPLLAVLLGSPIPVNSIGSIPLELLNMTEQQKAEAMLLNAKQITAQFKKNLETVKTQIISVFHSPFENLTNEELEFMISSITEQIKNEQYADAIDKSRVLIQIGLEGLNYYQNYYQRLLLISISSSYILWMGYLTLELYDSTSCDRKSWLKVFFTFSAILTLILITVQALPIMFFFYFLLPQLLLYLVCQKINVTHFQMISKNNLNLLFSLCVMLIGVEVIVTSFFYRWVLCVSTTVTLFWSAATNLPRLTTKIVSLWLLSGVILSAFCLLPIISGQPNVIMIVFSGFVLFIFLLFLFMMDYHQENIFMYSLRCICVAGASWNAAIVHTNFSDDAAVTEFNQYLSWSLFIFSLILLMIGKPFILERFNQVFISFLVPFLLLSIRHEGLFIMFLFIHLRCWIHVEYESMIVLHSKGEQMNKESASLSDFSRAYMFLLYVWLGFFGLGNIASLNSFDPAWVRCFTTVFSPFLMSALILFKTVIPFLMVTSSMRTLSVILRLRPEKIFIIVLIYCNIMGLNFLFLVKNKGSWLDIGSSISHYVIQQVTIVFLLMLYGISKFLLSFSFHLPVRYTTVDMDSKLSTDSSDSHEALLSLPRYYSNYKLHKL